ncbi:hypothetical protein [Rubrobacter calidifluminis]|uniref:hypothetical protein n=1 Tax=Rubrobacter calidifluminis TaxID=1392640 RepID=UPI0023628BE7|nr:hypothetical protein [Rubrobacter calidifluminis]
MDVEDLQSMDSDELLYLRRQIDALLIERELREHRRFRDREVIETRRIPGAVLRRELLRHPDGSTSGPYWFRYFFQEDRTEEISVRYLGPCDEGPPPQEDLQSRARENPAPKEGEDIPLRRVGQAR